MESYRELSQGVPNRSRRSEPVASAVEFLQKVPRPRQGSILAALACCCLIALGCGGPDPVEIVADDSYVLHPTAKDSRGHWNAKVEFPDQAAPIEQGQSYTKKVVVELPEECWLYKVDTFNGLDRGDIVEMDTFVYDRVGRALYQRSLHKESEAMYNSFWPIATDAITDRVGIHMHAHVTKADELARAHWNVMLWCAPVKGSSTDPSDYVSKSRAKRILEKMRDSRSDIWLDAWSGWRDEEYVAVRCAWGCEEYFDKTPSEMEAFSVVGMKLLQRQAGFKSNLGKVNRLCPEDARFCEVTEVATKSWDPYAEKCRAHRTVANWHREVAQQDPLAKECDPFDSIMGWCQCRDKPGG